MDLFSAGIDRMNFIHKLRDNERAVMEFVKRGGISLPHGIGGLPKGGGLGRGPAIPDGGFRDRNPEIQKQMMEDPEGKEVEIELKDLAQGEKVVNDKITRVDAKIAKIDAHINELFEQDELAKETKSFNLEKRRYPGMERELKTTQLERERLEKSRQGISTKQASARSKQTATEYQSDIIDMIERAKGKSGGGALPFASQTGTKAAVFISDVKGEAIKKFQSTAALHQWLKSEKGTTRHRAIGKFTPKTEFDTVHSPSLNGSLVFVKKKNLANFLM